MKQLQYKVVYQFYHICPLMQSSAPLVNNHPAGPHVSSPGITIVSRSLLLYLHGKKLNPNIKEEKAVWLRESETSTGPAKAPHNWSGQCYNIISLTSLKTTLPLFNT